MSVILLSEALRILHSGAVCSLSYVAADRKRGTGGKIIHLPQCVIYSQDPTPPHTQTVYPSIGSDRISTPTQTQTVYPSIGSDRLSTPTQSSDRLSTPNTPPENQPKNPSHYLNKTRNVYIPATRKIQKLHIKLITRFNGKKVLL